MKELRLSDIRLLVDHWEPALHFYRDALGLNLRFQVPGVYAEFDAGAAVLSLYRRSLMQDELGTLHEAASADRIVFTFDVDDVDATFRELVSKGATMVTEPHDQSTWEIRVAHLRDPDGNLFELDQLRA